VDARDDTDDAALLAAVRGARDRSVASPELAAVGDADWALGRHLSPYRTTVFDALGLHGARAAAVLQHDAGHGTLTRWLGERCGRVDAVEGRPGRAAVAVARCADLGDVRVLGAAPPEAGAYDLVTLAAGLGDDGEAPERLRAARAALREDGLCVVAVANRLGLKYLNGATDDGTGQAYDAVHGYPGAGAAGSSAFSLRALEALARDAGFDHLDVLLPFPDATLTSTLIDPAAFGDDPDAANWLLGTAPNRGRAPAPRAWAFSETLAQREVVRAGLLPDLANALVLLAYRGDPARTAARLGIERGWKARHWSLDRRPACRKRVTLTAGGAIVNELADYGPAGREALVDLGVFEHRLAAEPRRRGPLVVFAALEALVAEGGAGPRLHALIDRYAAWLEETFGTGRRDADGVALLAGDVLDAIWVNVIDDRDSGRWEAVDREWAFRGELPLDYVVWRAVADLRWRFATELPADLRAAAPAEMAYAIARAAGVMTGGAARLELARELEAAYHAAAGTGATPVPGPRVRALAAAGPQPRRFRILARAEELSASPALLKAYAKAFAGAALATLVLFSSGEPATALPALQAAIAAADLDEDTMPDTVLVGKDDLEADGEAVFTAGDWGPAPLARYGPDDLPALRALAERRWADGDQDD
jgi:hypothetical protein